MKLLKPTIRKISYIRGSKIAWEIREAFKETERFELNLKYNWELGNKPKSKKSSFQNKKAGETGLLIQRQKIHKCGWI